MKSLGTAHNSTHSDPSPPAASRSVHTAKPRCQASTRSGAPCAGVGGESGFCSFHDPALADVMAESRVAGGRARSKPAATVDIDAPDLQVESAADVVALIGDTINRVRKGTLDPRVANTIGYLSSIALRGIEVGELEERLARLETAVNVPGTRLGQGVFDRRVGKHHADGGATT